MTVRSDDTSQGEDFNVGRFIDEQRFGPVQILVLTLCLLVMICDGYDVYVMGFVLQPIAAHFGVSPASITPVFVLQNLGLAIGTFCVGPIADRVGRRKLVIASVFGFALLTLALTQVQSVSALITLRLVAGIFFAGLVPNAIALTCEFAPLRFRASFVTWTFIGYTGGAALGGLVTAALVTRYGWQSAFWVGGAVPLVLGFVLLALCPESIRFGLLRGGAKNEAGIRRMLERMNGGPLRPGKLVLHEPRIAGSTVAALFRKDRRRTTGLIALTFFCNLLVITLLGAFLPIFLHRFGGFSTERAAGLASLYSFSAMVASLFVGRIIDRIGTSPVLIVLYILGAGSLVALGSIDMQSPAIYVALCGVGIGVVTAQGGLNAFAAEVYPTAMRSTGVGWALGAGRIGGMVGPLIGGAALAENWSALSAFAATACPMLLAAVTVAVLSMLSGPKAKPSALSPEPLPS